MKIYCNNEPYDEPQCPILCFFPSSLLTLVNVEFAAMILHTSQLSACELLIELQDARLFDKFYPSG